MGDPLLLIILISAFVASFLITGIVYRTSIGSALVDMPGDRSSHTVPTPRGGGISFVLSVLAMLPLLCWQGFISVDVTLAMMGAGVMVGVVGFIDDYKGLSVSVRLLVHIIAVIWGLYWLKGLPALWVFGYSIDILSVKYVLAVLFLVWLLNLYNFMDGIDGLASVEVISVGFAFSIILFLFGGADIVLPLLLVFSVCGFLCWNFPPAKIFMGDAGSGFLGIIIGLISIHTAMNKPEFFWCWIILLGVFVVDATVTLIRRIVRKQKVHQAHRSHAFQYASRLYKSHKRVTLFVALINLSFLFPVAMLVSSGYLSGTTGVLITYVPLVALAIYYKAGAPDLQADLA